MILRFRSWVAGEEAVVHSILKYLFDPEVQADQRVQTGNVVGQSAEESNDILDSVLYLEKTAFNAGYSFAVAIRAGACRLCKTCTVIKSICRSPTMHGFPRISRKYLIKTAEHAGMQMWFPAPLPRTGSLFS